MASLEQLRAAHLKRGVSPTAASSTGVVAPVPHSSLAAPPALAITVRSDSQTGEDYKIGVLRASPSPPLASPPSASTNSARAKMVSPPAAAVAIGSTGSATRKLNTPKPAG